MQTVRCPITTRLPLRASNWDKVKCELRVASCELRVASCELRVASCKLRVVSCKMLDSKSENLYHNVLLESKSENLYHNVLL